MHDLRNMRKWNFPCAMRGMLACSVMFCATFMSASLYAQETEREPLFDRFELGWFHHLTGIQRLEEIAGTQAPLLIPYHDEELLPFLDKAHSLNIKVLPEIPRVYIDEQNLDAIMGYVAEYDSHPAVWGWYSADEPAIRRNHDWSPQIMEMVYNAIRIASDKPVYICFSYVEADRGDIERYKNAYDVFSINHYPYLLNNFSAERKAQALAYWTDLVVRVNKISQELDRPWLNTLQAIGPREGRRNMGWRLTTLDESRFQLYWTVLNNAEGAIYFCYYWVRAVHASPDEPYEEDGQTWLNEVFIPLVEEFLPMAEAFVPSNVVMDGVSSSNDVVVSRVYRDPSEEDSLVLLAVNSTPLPQGARLTLPEGNWQVETIIGCDGAKWNENQVDLFFRSNETRVYRLYVAE